MKFSGDAVRMEEDLLRWCIQPLLVQEMETDGDRKGKVTQVIVTLSGAGRAHQQLSEEETGGDGSQGDTESVPKRSRYSGRGEACSRGFGVNSQNEGPSSFFYRPLTSGDLQQTFNHPMTC